MLHIIIIILLIIVVLLFLYNKQEKLDATLNSPLSNEAIQNIASIYNNQNLQVTNLKVTNDISANGKITIPKLCSPNGTYCLSMQNDGNLVVYDKDLIPKFGSIQAQQAIDKYNSGQLWSADGKYKVIMQNDGNLVSSDKDNKLVFDTQSTLVNLRSTACNARGNDLWMTGAAYVGGYAFAKC